VIEAEEIETAVEALRAALQEIERTT